MWKTRQDPMTDEFMDLRSRAEATMQEKAIDLPDVSTLPTKELQALVHELQVHQIELEMQNEELKRLQLELDESRTSSWTFMISLLSGVLPPTVAMVQRVYSRR